MGLRHLRSNCVCALLNTDNYSASAWALFALLAPPSLEPEFALQSAALNLVLRAYRTPAMRRQLATDLGARPPIREGPTARVRQLHDFPVFEQVITDMLADRALPHSWKHDVRELFRVQACRRLATDRSQHFAWVQRGVNCDVTCSLLNMWTEQAAASR